MIEALYDSLESVSIAFWPVHIAIGLYAFARFISHSQIPRLSVGDIKWWLIMAMIFVQFVFHDNLLQTVEH